jgi:hypothetical protein
LPGRSSRTWSNVHYPFGERSPTPFVYARGGPERGQPAERLAVRRTRIAPVSLDRVPEVGDPLFVGVAVLDDQRRDALGVPGREPEPDRSAIVHDVEGVPLEAERVRQLLDHVGVVVERVRKVVPVGHGAVAEAG